jgi:hypothetical protein
VSTIDYDALERDASDLLTVSTRDITELDLMRVAARLRALIAHAKELERDKAAWKAAWAEDYRRAYRAERDALQARLKRTEEILDDACAVMRTPGTDNDGGPGDLAADCRLLKAEYERLADLYSGALRGNATLRARLDAMRVREPTDREVARLREYGFKEALCTWRDRLLDTEPTAQEEVVEPGARDAAGTLGYAPCLVCGRTEPHYDDSTHLYQPTPHPTAQGGTEDLRKAAWYLAREIARRKKE